MNDVIGARAPVWFRLLAVLGLAWNVVGVYMYFYLDAIDPSGDSLADLLLAHRGPAASLPTWVTVAFEVALYAGLGGTLMLVMLKRIARPLLILSLLAILVQCGWIVAMSNARAVEGIMAFVLPGAVTLVALFLVWLAMIGDRRGWLS
jgi:hypothetical protein